MALATALLGTAAPAWAEDGEQEHPAEELAAPGTVQQDGSDFPLNEAPTVYYPADFAAYSPRSALDMVEQLPGFNIDTGGGGGQNRGLGQANTNVLLNGERIVVKSGSITDELARIGADSVIRIELVEGSTLNIPGLSGRVANVVASSADGLQGQFEWRPQLAARYSENRWLEGIVSLSGTFGRLSFTVAAEGRPVRNGNGGPNIFTFGDGTVQERFSLTKANGDDKRFSGSVRYETAGGTIANLNSSYLHRRFRSFEDENVIAPASAPPVVERFDQRNRGHDREFGGDVDFALGPGRLKLIGLDAAQSLNFNTQSVVDPGTGDPATGSRFIQLRQTGERIGRSEYSWEMLNSDWQWSFEAAFNSLDQQGELFLLDPGGDFEQVQFAGATGGVREDRYESLLSFSHQLAGNLNMQLILGGEYSSIRQTGSNPNSRTFLRPKGSLSLGWTPEDGLSVSMRVDRRVGQLNFSDFLAAVNLNDNNQNAANNELRPDQSWGGEIEATKDFGAWGSASLRTFFRLFEDYVTIVPTPTGGEARGNVDFARIMGVELNATWQLAPMGLAGAKFDVRGRLRDSRYPDPVEGGFVPVEFARPHDLEIDFRYDVPGSNWAFGGGFRDTGQNPYYRVAEFGFDYSIDRNVTLFVEHKDVFGLSVQARVGNLLEREIVLDRQIFAGPRGSSPLLFRENRRREVGRVLSFTVKGSF
ncbi:TonB-dependent receptor plug domain-containing protein [Alteraurantiacibacter aquimixticola]|uniref:TonB-dependent receptor plug domain-containing protein n=1 Tax=Alteraurantiacibacter aquimixticola TaxID=2489173 RepID=A0A4T3F6I3_9SPHN|nr:TonB-dependent receptor plug domain-containing protein [Alteraurantiacibacter aquimixticola]TIX51282.1 hypothetical protein E5222_02110 [Alteraurantiacibacter aquimixticola]